MTHAQVQSAAPANVAEPPLEFDLHLQLRLALMKLALAQQRCQQLEMQLRDGQQRERRHLHRAEHDDLTGLLNRAAFRERLQQQLAGGGSVAVVVLDLDGFKLINDRHGHAAGDEVLRIIAARMGHALRNGDVLGRLGGDEFACLLKDAGGHAQLLALTAKLSASIASPMQVAGHRMCVKASLGLAINSEDGACVDTLMASADTAMYRAKRRQKLGLAVCSPVQSHGTQSPHAADLAADDPGRSARP